MPERSPASLLPSLARVGGRGGSPASITDAPPLTDAQYLMAQEVVREIARYALFLAQPFELERFMDATDARQAEPALTLATRVRLASDYRLAEALRPYLEAVCEHVS